MPEQKDQRQAIDQMAKQIVESQRATGGQADFQKVRERLRQHQIRSENKDHSRKA